MKKGFTLPELIIVMGMMALLVSYATVSLFGAKNKSSLNTSVTTLVADLRHQQLKAMVGDTEDRASHDAYGIFFGADSYTLFHGLVYNPADSANFVLKLGDNLNFVNVLFPNSQVVFTSVSGNVANFIDESNALTIRNAQTGEEKTLKINRYGVVIEVN